MHGVQRAAHARAAITTASRLVIDADQGPQSEPSIARMRTPQSVRLAGAFVGKNGTRNAELRAQVRQLLEP